MEDRESKRQLDLRTQAEEQADNLADLVNCFDREVIAKSFAERICFRTHRTLQASISYIVFRLIRTWANCWKQGKYDGRNEFTCKGCNEIVTLMDEKSFHKEYWDKPPFI